MTSNDRVNNPRLGARKKVYRDTDTILKIRELALCGARPPVIRSIFPSFPETTITNLWVEACGDRPPRGPLPYNIKKFLASPAMRFQVALVLTVFLQLRNAGFSDIDALLGTFKACVDRFGIGKVYSNRREFTFDSVWFIVRQYTSIQSLVLVTCPRCGAKYVLSREERFDENLCPTRVLGQDICVPKRRPSKAPTASTAMIERIIESSVSDLLPPMTERKRAHKAAD